MGNSAGKKKNLFSQYRKGEDAEFEYEKYSSKPPLSHDGFFLRSRPN